MFHLADVVAFRPFSTIDYGIIVRCDVMKVFAIEFFLCILFSDDFIAAFVHQRSVLCWISLFCATRCVDVCAFCSIYDGNSDKYVHRDTCRRRKIYRTIELFYLFC